MKISGKQRTEWEAVRSFRELVQMFGGPGFIMSMYAYADESGTHGDSKVVIIAGWLSTYKKWLTFSRQWQHALNEKHAPYLHMKDLGSKARRNAKNPFRNWSDARVDRFVHAMIPIARDNALFGLICAVEMAGYNRLHPQLRKTDYPSPYIFAFQLFFEQLLKVVNGETPFKRGVLPDDDCILTCEQGPQEEFAHKAFHLFKQIKDKNNRYRGISFLNARDEKQNNGIVIRGTLPLQAADLLANRAYHIYQAEIIRGEQMKRDTWDRELKAGHNLFISEMKEEGCVEFMQRIEKKHGKS